MFHPDYSLDLPTGSSLLAEIGIDPLTVREVIDDDRAIRCPERGAEFPAYGFANLAPEPPFGMSLQDAAPAEPWDPASSLPPAGLEVEEGLKRLNGRGFGGVNPAPVVRNPSSTLGPMRRSSWPSDSIAWN